MKDSLRRAKNKYKQKLMRLRIDLYPTEGDIKAKLAERVTSGEPRATYIKRLIREDIKRQQ